MEFFLPELSYMFCAVDFIVLTCQYVSWCLRCAEELNNSTKLSCSWKSISSPATQEFHNILWNWNVHYNVCKGPPLTLTLNQISPVHTTPTSLSLLRSILILYLHLLHLHLPNSLFWLSQHLYYMPCPSYAPFPDHSNDKYTSQTVQVKKLFIMYV
jgi:hypothetical protein